MKSPKQIRSDIRTLTQHLEQVREGLLAKADISIAQIGKECSRTAEALGDLLRAHNLPEDYRVAVFGRFKTGKSSFVTPDSAVGPKSRLSSESAFTAPALCGTAARGC
jgi:hypothetical protein